MKLRLADIERNEKSYDCYVKRLPKEEELIYLKDGKYVAIQFIAQVAKEDENEKKPDYVALVKYMPEVK